MSNAPNPDNVKRIGNDFYLDWFTGWPEGIRVNALLEGIRDA